MSITSLPRLVSIPSLLCVLASLVACGGNVDTTASTASTAAPVLAASSAHMPVADCEPQACQGMRIIDSNAETFRADNARREALASAVAKMDAH
jgi:hypothetical protein